MFILVGQFKNVTQGRMVTGSASLIKNSKIRLYPCMPMISIQTAWTLKTLKLQLLRKHALETFKRKEFRVVDKYRTTLLGLNRFKTL